MGGESSVGCDRDVEAISETSVLDRHGHGVLVRVPGQDDVDAVVLTDGKFSGVRC